MLTTTITRFKHDASTIMRLPLQHVLGLDEPTVLSAPSPRSLTHVVSPPLSSFPASPDANSFRLHHLIQAFFVLRPLRRTRDPCGMKRPALPCPGQGTCDASPSGPFARLQSKCRSRAHLLGYVRLQRETELCKKISRCMAIQVLRLRLLGSHRLAGKDCARDHDIAGSGGNDIYMGEVALRPVRAESHGSDPVALAQMLLELEMTESCDREDGPATGTVEFILERAVRERLEFGARVGWKVSSTSFSVVRAKKRERPPPLDDFALSKGRLCPP